jgi:16S rRNA A1518/A1519 N6-dimethyltransferase RsmA/KsgA/DIM1 with predicted DNA glycosylase/AP lyase activity
VYIVEDERGVKSSHYLLDEVLDVGRGVGKISENLCEKIVELVCESPYRKASETLSELSRQPLSHTSVWNVSQEIGSRVKAEEESCASRARASRGTGEVVSRVLFEEQDGIHSCLPAGRCLSKENLVRSMEVTENCLPVGRQESGYRVQRLGADG